MRNRINSFLLKTGEITVFSGRYFREINDHTSYTFLTTRHKKRSYIAVRPFWYKKL